MDQDHSNVQVFTDKEMHDLTALVTQCETIAFKGLNARHAVTAYGPESAIPIVRQLLTYALGIEDELTETEEN